VCERERRKESRDRNCGGVIGKERGNERKKVEEEKRKAEKERQPERERER
jgi:hypothetical protein